MSLARRRRLPGRCWSPPMRAATSTSTAPARTWRRRSSRTSRPATTSSRCARRGSPPGARPSPWSPGSRSRSPPPSAPPRGNGSLRVISNEPDVEVFVDGEDKGKAPVTMTDTRPGEHIVGARKKGFKPQEQTVRVASNENAIVSFRMEVAPPDRPHGGLKVQSTIPNAEVFLDGSSLGRAPVDRNDLDPGKHYVSVHRDGYTDFKREIVLVENQAVDAGRRPVGDAARCASCRRPRAPRCGSTASSSARRRSFTTPSAGDHVVEFRLKGYFDHKETMKADGGREKVFSVDLKLIPTGPIARAGRASGGRRCRRSAPGSTRSAASPSTSASAIPSTSRPASWSGRCQPTSYLGLDVGVAVPDVVRHHRLRAARPAPVRSTSARSRWRPRRTWAAAPASTAAASFFVDCGPVASLAFADIATVSAFGAASRPGTITSVRPAGS